MRQTTSEIERIRAEYRARASDPAERNRWSALNPAEYFAVVQRERRVLDLLKANGYNQHNFECLRILDVGCGWGGWLRRLVEFGARVENLYGVDLSEERILNAKQRSAPGVNLFVLDAQELPFEDRSFDVLFQFTVFTSILDFSVKSRLSSEMMRVLKRDGLIVWYDFKPHIRYLRRLMDLVRTSADTPYHALPIGCDEIGRLFPTCSIRFSTATLHYYLRGLASYGWLGPELLEKFPFLRTHVLAGIKLVQADKA